MGSMKIVKNWLQRHRLFWTRSLDRLAKCTEAKKRETQGKSR
jgi:hypothetical protein